MQSLKTIASKKYSCKKFLHLPQCRKNEEVPLLLKLLFPHNSGPHGRNCTKFHPYSVIWNRYPVQSFKTIASKKYPSYVRNSYTFLNVEKKAKSQKNLFPHNLDQIVETPPNFHKCSSEPFKIPTQSLSFIAPL